MIFGHAKKVSGFEREVVTIVRLREINVISRISDMLRSLLSGDDIWVH